MNTTKNNQNQEITIGLFDSGVGGLSVLQHLSDSLKTLPANARFRLLYLGDTARCPYGNREPQEIASFVSQISNWLLAQGAQLIVIACNTSTALAGHFAKAHLSVPVFDLITPTAKYIASKSLNVTVLATEATVKSQAFSKCINEYQPGLSVQEIACPELVPLIEKGLIEDQQTFDVLKKYASLIDFDNTQAIVLGCTHYPFISKVLGKLLPAKIEFINPAHHFISDLFSAAPWINQHQNDSTGAVVSESLYVTGSPASFAKTAAICLNREISTVFGITIGELLSPSSTPYLVPNSSESLKSLKAIP